MPSLSIIRSAVAELPKGPPLVAAFPGGTTGIGSYVVKAIAKAYASHGSQLRVYIVGRNASRAEALMAECELRSPGSEWYFVQATDLALISEVDRSCAEIIRRETESPFHGGSVRLDLLYMSHCYPIFKERTTTSEGIDAFLSTVYYSRIRFIMQLMPLLTASPLPGHVVSVYSGGMEDGTKAGEMPIGCPPPDTYGIGAVRKHTSFMKNFIFEELAQKHAGRLSLSHIFPGLVDGPTFYSSDIPSWFKLVWRVSKPLLSLVYITSADDCGQVMLYLATSRYPAKGTVANHSKSTVGGVEIAKSTKGELGGGSYALGQRGDVQTKGVSYEKVRREGMSKEVWDHTMGTLERIEKANAKASGRVV